MNSIQGINDNYTNLLLHITITQEYSINKGRNLWVDPYYVGEMRRLERLIAFGEMIQRAKPARLVL